MAKRNKKKTTVPGTREKIELLAAANSNGDILHATGGGHITSDDIFRAEQITLNIVKIKESEDKKKFSGKIEFYEVEEKKVLAKKK